MKVVKSLSRYAIRRLSKIGNPITIPEALIKRLIERYDSSKRFILVRQPTPGDSKTGKNPREHGWQDHPHDAEDERLQTHLRNGGNYGVVAGNGFYIIDADDKRAANKLVASGYDETFTVQTGSGKAWHFYFDGVEDNGILTAEDGSHLGEIRAYNQQVVGPGSRHWSGGEYKIVKDLKIAHLGKRELERIFGKELKWTGQQLKDNNEAAANECKRDEIPIDKLINLEGFVASGGELQGAHPVHGSTTGKNFCVNVTKNRWHCFRHHTGGGPLSWIAVEAGLIECQDVRRGALSPSMKKEALEIAKSRGFQVHVPTEELNPDVARFYKKDNKGNLKFVAGRLAMELMKEIRYLTQITRTKEGVMFRYNKAKGIYQPDALSYINSQVRKKLGEVYDINKERQVEAFIRASTYREIPETSKELIATKNGVLNVVTLEFFPFSPDFYIFNAIPVTYDPKAECLLFKRTLTEWTSPDGQKLLQEHAGHTLYKDNTRFQKALMLIGLAQNGKGTWLNTIQGMLGHPDNVSAVALNVLSDSSRRFAVTQLYNKLANICADIGSKRLKETDIFKKAVSGDLLEGEFKFQQEFSFKPYAKLFFSANELPPMPSKGFEAFMVRWNLVDFPNSFLPDDPKRDPDLLKKLTTPEELSGILNWALEGLQRLMNQGHFSENLTLTQKAREWDIRADAIKAFTEEHVVSDVEAQIDGTKVEEGTPKTADVYKRYQDFCKEHKVAPVTRNAFTRRFRERCPDAQYSRTRDGHVWEGIRLRTSGKNEVESDME